MTLTVQSKYLVFPVNTKATEKILTLLESGKPLCSLKLLLDPEAPDFYAYVDVARFLGKTISLSIEPEMAIDYREADTLAYTANYREPNRPQVHFTVKNGWHNDPNGLVRVGDTYHMFYQYNPAAPAAGSAHWGHATSTDLLHWQEQDPVLFPDETGDKWSGSAIIDYDNVSGLGDGNEPPVLLYYTATNPFAQHVAYSTDGLKTIKKYGSEPVVPHIMRTNRDPKVVFCEERGDYLMVIHLVTTRFQILCSHDLLHWTPLQELFLEGESECPDLFPLCDENGMRHWVFIGARSRYLVGDMTAEGFIPIQKPQSLYYGGVVLAGQTFSGLDDGRIVRLDWDCWSLDTPPFAGQMSVPYELSLQRKDDIYWLCATPIHELETLFEKEIREEAIALSPTAPHSILMESKPYHLTLKINELADTRLSLTVFGRTLTLYGKENSVSLGEMHAPLRRSGKALELCLIIDRCSIEAFLDGGSVYLGGATPDTASNDTQSTLTIRTDAPCTLDALVLHPLRSIWE